MTHIEILPILLPLFGAIAILFAKLLNHKTQQLLSILLVFLLILVNIIALSDVKNSGTLVYQLGNWPAPFGITLVLDKLSALLVLLTSVLALGSLWYAIARGVDGKGIHFHVLFQLQLFGLNGAFLTGDVFNLFVFFEVLLLASYALLLYGNGDQRVKFGMHYVVINLIGSTLFLFAVGTLYGVIGTLNIADMALKIANLSPDNQGVVAAAGLMLLFVFGLKAAMFPLYFWLPGAYSNTSAPVAALFAIMTKVGIYAIIRVHGTIFGPEAGELSFYHLPWVLGLGVITLVLGTIGVMSASRLKEQVAYLILTSVATLLIAIGVNSQTALSGAFYYTIHSTLIGAGFFLYADIFELLRGEYKDNLVRTPSFKNIILSGSLFFAFAIAIAGMPPLSGFFGKMMILSGALESSLTWLVYSAVLITSLGIIVALTRTGSRVFYHVLPDAKPLQESISWRDYLPVFYFLFLSVLMVILANPLSQYTNQCAALIYDVGNYISEVLQEVN